MNKERRSKSLIIVALALTLIVLTVGFAAFSTTLNISSNATVSPNQEDFKITIYGFSSVESAKKYELNRTFEDSDLSTTISYPDSTDNVLSATTATINNSTYTISNIEVSLKEPETSSVYFFIIKNEGKYDAYLDLSKYEYNSGSYLKLNTGTCTIEEGTTQELLDAACPYIMSIVEIFDYNGDSITSEENIIKIEKGSYIGFGYGIGYLETENRVDGPFSVEFPAEQLIFSTAK